MGIMNQAIQDGIGNGWITDTFMPMFSARVAPRQVSDSMNEYLRKEAGFGKGRGDVV